MILICLCKGDFTSVTTEVDTHDEPSDDEESFPAHINISAKLFNKIIVDLNSLELIARQLDDATIIDNVKEKKRCQIEA